MTMHRCKRFTDPLEPSAKRRTRRTNPTLPCTIALLLLGAAVAHPNGGPFLIKYPGGDPAAKGVLAPLADELMPGRENRLKVLYENLFIDFHPPRQVVAPASSPSTPLVTVTAEYVITNATAEMVEVTFGFPILRGIFMNPWAMTAMPDATVTINGTNRIRPELISNSVIYNHLRSKAVKAIEQGIAANPKLQALTADLAAAAGGEKFSARTKVINYLVNQVGWSHRDAVLLAEYVMLKPKGDQPGAVSPGRETGGMPPPPARGPGSGARPAAPFEAGWACAAIGEQKATQWLVLLARCLAPQNHPDYEAIFQAWGGDVRERSIDLGTGLVRPRENTAATTTATPILGGEFEPTLYARVDYVNRELKMTPEEKASWEMVTRELPVVFTFAPMNLLRYQVRFPAGDVSTVSVSYRQYGYLDSGWPRSFQLAYVLHPASFWDSFGPIHLTVTTPATARPVASVPLEPDSAPVNIQGGARTTSGVTPLPGQRLVFNPEPFGRPGGEAPTLKAFRTKLDQKTGELFVAVPAVDWEKPSPRADSGAQREAQVAAKPTRP